MRLPLVLLPFALAACQAAEPEPAPVIDDAVLAVATRCLAEVGQQVPPGTDIRATNVRITPQQQAAYEACLAREL